MALSPHSAVGNKDKKRGQKELVSEINWMNQYAKLNEWMNFYENIKKSKSTNCSFVPELCHRKADVFFIKMLWNDGGRRKIKRLKKKKNSLN